MRKISLLACMIFAGQAFAAGDYYQNSWSNNIAFDSPQKWYVGGAVGLGMLSDHSTSQLSANGNSASFGVFGGRKVSDYFAFELDVERLAHLEADSSSKTSYRTNVYNASIDALLSYPIVSAYSYATDVYGKIGYGLNIANFSMGEESGNMNRGTYNFGLGVNVDLRSNVSMRLGYTYYRAYYPLPGGGNKHNVSQISLGVFYNF